MVASRPLGPLDVAQQESPRADTSPAASVSTSPSSPARPLLPAERDINAAMDGFNAGVVDFLKGKEGVVSFAKRPTHFVFALGVVFFYLFSASPAVFLLQRRLSHTTETCRTWTIPMVYPLVWYNRPFLCSLQSFTVCEMRHELKRLSDY